MNKVIKVKLANDTYSTDEIGQKIPAVTYTEIFGTRESISRTEWNQAGERGLKPAFMVKVYTFEYGGQEKCQIDNVEYAIYRTYEKGDVTELYLEKQVGV